MERHLAAAEGLASAAGTASDLDQLMQTPQFSEYVAANDHGGRTCLEVQERLDALAAASDSVANTPWLTSLGVTVRTTFGCEAPE